MTFLLRFTVVLTGLFFIAIAILSVVLRRLSERQSYFWIFSGMGIIPFGLFPGLSGTIAKVFGVDYIPSIIFMFANLIAFYGIFSCFQAIASLSKQVQELAMHVSLLNRENSLLVRELEQKSLQREGVDN